MSEGSLGVSGRIARAFQNSRMTPLLGLVALLMGVFATIVTPREEEPQIDVTMADVMIAWPGASARDVENLVARPAEQVLSRLHGVEHVYSVSRRDLAVVTVQFAVGVKYNDAVLRLHDTVASHQDRPGVRQRVEHGRQLERQPQARSERRRRHRSRPRRQHRRHGGVRALQDADARQSGPGSRMPRDRIRER